MIALFIVVATVSVAAPLIQALLWRVPFGQLSIAMVLRAMLGAGATAGVFGGVVLACLPFSMAEDRATSIAAGIGGAMGLGLSTIWASRLRKFRGILLLAHRVREPGGTKAALASLRESLARERKNSAPQVYAKMVLLVIAPLTHANLWRDAEALLSELDPASLDAKQRGLRAQGLATCRLHLGDIDGADAALSDGDQASDPSIAPWLATSRALIVVLQGDAVRALEMVGDPLEEHETLLRASKQIVCAHAYARLGDEKKAREALSEVFDEAGRSGLERAVRPEGPATPLAVAMLEKRGATYQGTDV